MPSCKVLGASFALRMGKVAERAFTQQNGSSPNGTEQNGFVIGESKGTAVMSVTLALP